MAKYTIVGIRDRITRAIASLTGMELAHAVRQEFPPFPENPETSIEYQESWQRAWDQVWVDPSTSRVAMGMHKTKPAPKQEISPKPAARSEQPGLTFVPADPSPPRILNSMIASVDRDREVAEALKKASRNHSPDTLSIVVTVDNGYQGEERRKAPRLKF